MVLMQKQLERIRHQLLEHRGSNEKIKDYIDSLLNSYDEVLHQPVREQIDFIHQAQRLIKLSAAKVYKYPRLFKKVLKAKDPSWVEMKPLNVAEELKTALAKQLFISSGARSGEKIIIATTEEGREVSEELVRLCLESEVDFELGIKDPLRMLYLINELEVDGLQALADLNLKKYEGVNREIVVTSSSDPGIKKQIVQEKMKIYRKLNQEIHDRAMSGQLHYTLTRIPTPHDAAADDMDYMDYLKLFFELCDQPWKQIQIAQGKLIEKFDKAKIVHITNSDGTDITMDITGQTFANSVIAKNIPGSEIFSSPLRESVNGVVVAKGKFQYGAKDLIEDITMKFKDGRLYEYSARVNQEGLEKIITADDEHEEGTRHLGELGIGTNPHLRKHVVNGLLVEKIAGSFHLALGSSYTYSNYLGTPVNLDNGNRSFSGIHWDITTMLRGKDGKMYLDGELVQDNGDWIGEEYAVLNEGWGAVSEEMRPAWYGLN